MSRLISRSSSLLTTTICAVIGTVAVADQASARGFGGGFHGSGGGFHYGSSFHYGGAVSAPTRIRAPRGPVYHTEAIVKSTVRSGTVKFPPAVSPAAMGVPTIKVSQIPASPNAPATLHPTSPVINVSQMPASPNAPANLGDALNSTGLNIPQSPASPNAPANPGNVGNAPAGPVVTIPQSPASPTAPGKVLLPANPGTGGTTTGGTPVPTPMRRTDASYGPLGIGAGVVVEDACYWIKAKFASQEGPVVRLVKVCDITDANQP